MPRPAPAEGLDLGGGLRHVYHIHYRDVGARLREAESIRLADAAAGAGDDRHLAV